MQELDLHCQVDEDVFSWTVFLTRVLVGLTLLYVAVGGLLYYREFFFNTSVLGWPMPVATGVALLVTQIMLALLLLLGWFTRLVSAISVLCMGAVGIIFFAGEINRIYVALILLLITALLPSVLLGPGKISLDYKHAVRRIKKTFRG